MAVRARDGHHGLLATIMSQFKALFAEPNLQQTRRRLPSLHRRTSLTTMKGPQHPKARQLRSQLLCEVQRMA